MGGKQAGGVLIALVGAVLVVAGVRGTLGDVWAALVKASPTAIDPSVPIKTPPKSTTDQYMPGYPGTGVTA